MSANPDVRYTLGAILAGAFLSTTLSGALSVQAFLYVRHYPKDPIYLKALVALVWSMDTAQTCCVVLLSYQYLIFNFSILETDHIFWTTVASLVFTAVTTFTVNGYFAYRVHKLSQGNWWLTVSTALCLVSRLGVAMVTGVEMVHLRSFLLYKEQFGHLFTAGLSLSAITDILITVGLCYYLRTLNRGQFQTKKKLTTIVSFADNNGALTCLVAIACLVCWVLMPTNMVYLGLHFTIGKCYSNSLLATLNMRDYDKRTVGTTVEVVNLMGPSSLYSSATFPMIDRTRTQWSGLDTYDEAQPRIGAAASTGQLEIKIDRTVHYE